MAYNAQSDDPVVRETFHKREDSAAGDAMRRLRESVRRMLLLLRYAMFLAPLQITSILLLDLPLRFYDRFAGGQDLLSPSNWLSWGEGLLVISLGIAAFVARCHGAQFATRVIGLAWLITACIIIALLIYIAPQLEAGDLPGMRFMVGFFLSWYVGQIICVHIYDITRGGKWWRAPFYGLIIGFAVQVLMYFPIVYGDAGAVRNVPWLNWALIDFCIKAILSVAFLPIYHSFRRQLRPHLGLGGY